MIELMSPYRFQVAPATSADVVPLRVPALLYVYLAHITNPNCCDVLVLEGTLEMELLRDALRVVVRSHPRLQHKLVRARGRFAWEQTHDAPPLHVHHIETNDATETLWRNVWGPSSYENGRAVAFHLTVTPGRSYLQVVSPHFATDAGSGALVCREIADAYTALAEGRVAGDGTARTDPSRELVRVSNASVGLRQRAHLWGRVASETWKDLASGGVGLVFSEEVPRGRMQVRKLELGAGLLTALKEEARKRNTTLHPLLCLATLRAREGFNARQGRPGERAVLTDLVSLRRFGAMQDAYDTLSLPCSHVLDPNLSDDELIRRLNERLTALKSGDALAEVYRLSALTSRMSPPRMAAQIASQLGRDANLTLTNPGLVPYPMERMGPVRISDFYNFAPCFPPGRLMLAVSSFRSSLRVVATYDESAFPEGIEGAFLDRFAAELNRLARGEASSERLRLMERFGNTCGMAALENAQSHFTAPGHSGYIALSRHGSVGWIAGDPVCAPEDRTALLRACLAYSRRERLKLCAHGLSKDSAQVFAREGLRIFRVGQEPILELEQFSLEGHTRAQLRQRLRQAERAKLRIDEVRPEYLSPVELAALSQVSAEWLKSKPGEMSFLLSRFGFQHSTHKRYFRAATPDGRATAVVILTPRGEGRGWFFDVTRARPDSPPGTMERLVVEILFRLQAEKVPEVSLGMCPHQVVDCAVPGLPDSEFPLRLRPLLALYGRSYRPIARYKRKFAPTRWENIYLATQGRLRARDIYALMRLFYPDAVARPMRWQLEKTLESLRDSG